MACMPMPAVLTSKLTSVQSSFTASTSFFRMLPASQGDCRKMLTQVFGLPHGKAPRDTQQHASLALR